ncbi:MAG: T9SS type A sorting domain-containing protein, partial [Bacteroidales bacterium]|nr:T9SS type A sorting domain-containing protein [Bacteroidales bacterium]
KDINGNEVIKATLSKDNGKQTIYINNLSTGIYYYTVTKNSTIIKSDKLVVVK